MNLFSLLFCFHGRIGRVHWWLGMAIVAASAISVIVGIGHLGLPPILFLPSTLLSTFPVFALGIKRLLQQIGRQMRRQRDEYLHPLLFSLDGARGIKHLLQQVGRQMRRQRHECFRARPIMRHSARGIKHLLQQVGRQVRHQCDEYLHPLLFSLDGARGIKRLFQ